MADRKRPSRKRAAPGAEAAPTAVPAPADTNATAPPPSGEQQEHATLLSAAKFVQEGGFNGYPRTFESVKDFAVKTGRLVRVDNAWLDAVHGAGANATGDDAAAPKRYGHLWKLLAALMRAPVTATPHAEKLMVEVHTLIAQGVGLLGPDVKTTMFPGPMARPLTETSCQALVSNTGTQEASATTSPAGTAVEGSAAAATAAAATAAAASADGTAEEGAPSAAPPPAAAPQPPPKYWLLEKSDGLRVMMYSKFETGFPRWSMLGPARDGQGQAFKMLSLYDSLLLEFSYDAMVQKGKKQSKPGMPLSHAVKGSEQLSLVVRDDKTLVLQAASGAAAPVRRSTDEGYSFGYVFDRSFDVFLLLDEIGFAGKSAILDGELVLNLKTQRVDYLLFDAPVVADHRRDNGGADARVDILLGMQPMSTRIEAMHALIGRRAASHAAAHYESYIAIKTKEFYRAEAVETLLNKIVKTEGGEYVYAEENRTDGIVLTPESGEAMQFRPGTCAALLKWKFPDTLTVDWHARVTSGYEDATPRHFDMRYIVKDKGTDASWYEEHVLFKSDALRSMKGVERMEAGIDYIAECKFHTPGKGRLGFWVVANVRKDKTAANSYMTSASVLESIAENFDAAKLIAKLKPRGAKGAGQAAATVQPSRGVGSRFKRPYCCFILRMHRDVTSSDPLEKRLTLQVRVKTSKFTHPRSFSYVAAEETFGFGCASPAVDKKSPMLWLLYIALANQGGCYHWSDCVVDAVFDPAVGRWEILRVLPRSRDAKNKATIKGVLDHLEETCSYGKSHHHITGADGVEAVRTTLVDSDQHYAERSVDKQLDSRVTGDRSNLRGFNNWIKSVLITTMANAADPSHMEYIATPEAREVNATKSQLAERVRRGKSLRVLDLCCGRGGDLLKWFATHPRAYVGIDSCLQAVGVAAKRYADGSTSTNSKLGVGMEARFIPMDAFSPACLGRALNALDDLLQDASIEYVGATNRYSCVSCQFSLHYAFATRDRAAAAIHNVASALQEGGVFFGTLVNSRELLARRAQHGDTFGNNSYKVVFKDDVSAAVAGDTADPDNEALYGQRYNFTLEACVDGEDEYVVHWDAFVALCARHRLTLIEAKPFRDFYRTRAAEEEHAAMWAKTVGAPRDMAAAAAAAAARAEPPAKKMRLSSPEVNPTSPNLRPTSPELAPSSPNLQPAAPEAPPAAPEPVYDGPPPLVNIDEYLTQEEKTASFLYMTFAFVKDAAE